MKSNLNRRWLYLILGVVSMLFAGIIYGWSILKEPFMEFWSAPELALNFTLTMIFFCLGGFLGARICKAFGIRIAITVSAVLSGAGFMLCTFITGTSVHLLYGTYGILAGLGIGIAYNAVISTVNAWFPDKKGLCSGCLMMGFGASSLVVGNLFSRLMAFLDWKTAYFLLGSGLMLVLFITAFILKKPNPDTDFPAPKMKRAANSEDFQTEDWPTFAMVRRKSFWLAFICLGLLGAVGSSVISFARDLALAVGAQPALATTLVGVLSVCNGLGRIFTGALFDAKGRRFTMLAANILTISAAAVTLIAVSLGSLPMCIIGLGLVGMSYGACPTVSSAFVSVFYGSRYFPTNFSIMNFNLIGSSLMATACSGLLTYSGSYVAPFMVLLVLSILALILNLRLKKP